MSDILMAFMFSPAGSGIGDPVRIKGLVQNGTTGDQLDTEMIASLVGGNVYWFEFQCRGNSPNAGTQPSANFIYTGSVSYGCAHRATRTGSMSEASTSPDTAAVSANFEADTTLAASRAYTTGTISGANPAYNEFTLHYYTGLIAPSTDGLLYFNFGVSSTNQTPRSQPYGIFRLEQLN